jgi:hypothetical protein
MKFQCIFSNWFEHVLYVDEDEEEGQNGRADGMGAQNQG